MPGLPKRARYRGGWVRVLYYWPAQGDTPGRYRILLSDDAQRFVTRNQLTFVREK